MSSRALPRKPGVLEFRPEILRDEKSLVNEIEKILGLQPEAAESVIGRTSGTAYRRVHEIVASALDRVEEAVRSLKLAPQDAPKALPPLLIDLSKALIMVRYQAARGQASDVLANYIDPLIRSIIDVIKDVEKGVDKGKLDEIERIVRNARAVLDAIAVLVYEYT